MNKTNATIGIFGIISVGLLSSAVMLGQSRRISKLEAENASLKSKNKTLKESIGKECSDETVKEYNEKVDLLEAQLDSAKRVIVNKENKIVSINKDMDELVEKISLKEEEISSLSEEIDKLKDELNTKPKEVIKEVTDLSSLNKIDELTGANKALTTRCSAQLEKIKELKLQLIESNKKLKSTQEELDGLKEQIKLIINTRNEEAELIKVANRTVDRVNKKVKAGGDS